MCSTAFNQERTLHYELSSGIKYVLYGAFWHALWLYHYMDMHIWSVNIRTWQMLGSRATFPEKWYKFVFFFYLVFFLPVLLLSLLLFLELCYFVDFKHVRWAVGWTDKRRELLLTTRTAKHTDKRTDKNTWNTDGQTDKTANGLTDKNTSCWTDKTSNGRSEERRSTGQRNELSDR